MPNRARSRRPALPIVISILLGAAVPVSAQPLPDDVDAVIARHVEARGGLDALRGIRSLVYGEGRYSEPGFTGSGQSVMMLMRPWYKLVGHPERDPRFLEGYDGAAWEWYADPGIVVRTVGAPAAAIRHYADVEGPLVDWREKGHAVELGEPATVAGRPAHRLIVTMPDGYVTESFLDRETYLEVASRHRAQVHAFGDSVATETRISDHREVAGVLFAHRFAETRIATGEEVSTMHWGRIEANVEIPVEWFSPPEYERTPLQAFLERLYVQRADVDAVMWTYRGFRRGHPETATGPGVEAVGFQILKTGDHDAAIALLEANRADHPESASAAFGLGRAYATAGRTEEARAALERALELDPEQDRARRALAELDG